jgi:hypothetical protein
MSFSLLTANLTNPALLFFLLGILSVLVHSDLEIPNDASKFISLYLLFAIGFKGGQELAHSIFTSEIVFSIFFGIFIACAIPFYTFFLLKRKFSIDDSGAIAASYGSVSAVTFITAISFLSLQNLESGGHMVAVMAMMEAPAIIIGVMLIRLFNDEPEKRSIDLIPIVKQALTAGSVLLILGSLLIGLAASEKQALGIKPFTTDIFQGFLAIFLLDMGIVSGRKLKDFFKNGWFPAIFAILIPLINGSVVALLSRYITVDIGNRFIFAVLAASASYIAVPAAMSIEAPKANPGIFLPMALGVTFPFNISFGMTIYMTIINLT